MIRRNLLLVSLLGGAALWGQESRPASHFQVKFDLAGITSLKYAGDQYYTDYIAPEGGGRQFSTTDTKNRVQEAGRGAASRRAVEHAVIYNPQDWRRNEYYADLELTERFHVEARS